MEKQGWTEREGTYSRVKHATRHSVKRPNIGSNGAAESRRDKQERSRIKGSPPADKQDCLRCREREEEEHKGTAELGERRNHLVPQGMLHAKRPGALDGIPHDLICCAAAMVMVA